VDLSGNATDAQEALPDSAFHWQVILNHCPSTCHQHPLQSFDGVRTASLPAPDHDYPASLTIELTVTDSGGLSDTKSLTIDPRTVQLSISSTPPGVEIALDLATVTTPFTETVIQGSQHSVTAPSEFDSGGQTYDFESWSDGGDRTHIVDIDEDTNLGATYSSLLPPLVLGETIKGASCLGEPSTVLGTKRNDVLVGTKGRDVIAGLGGKDKLLGRGGDDLLCGGDGDDQLKGGKGTDDLKGGSGSDRCVGGSTADRMAGCERVIGR
jgi:hypothetical protein